MGIWLLVVSPSLPLPHFSASLDGLPGKQTEVKIYMQHIYGGCFWHQVCRVEPRREVKKVDKADRGVDCTKF